MKLLERLFLPWHRLWLMVGSASKDCSRVDLTDILSVLKDALDVHLPFAWMAFASDTASAFAQTGLFKEKTDEA